MSIQIIDEKLFDKVSGLAENSPRLRMNYNFHENESDPVNRLINVMHPGTYILPHRHLNPDKQESFLVLRGELVTFLFDDNGNITDRLLVSPSKGVYGMEIPPHIWHTLVVLEHGTVVYEVKQGPFTPLSAENTAPWAPAASDAQAVESFIQNLMGEVKL